MAINNLIAVLILIVVDNGLVPDDLREKLNSSLSLNPYCSGQWTSTNNIINHQISFISLNPYCSGQWTSTLRNLIKPSLAGCLNPYCSGQWTSTVVDAQGEFKDFAS